ncbi:MAG TPA: IS630 transposase-related protein [Phycisphaerales bacterium]|nr:IS630 transposase-related protein [Phycisphaerales bacterium]
MPASYSDDLRDRVLAAYDRGMKTRAIADIFQVSPAWARRVKQTRRETGRTRPLKVGGRRPRKIDGDRLAKLVEQKPDATLKELRELLEVKCSLSAVHNALGRLKVSFKKSRSTPRSRTGPTSRSGVHAGSSGVQGSTPGD